MTKKPLKEKSYAFALRIVRLVRYVQETKREYILTKQLIRSGTSIGALIREAEYGQSRADFISKMSIALKEANETDYWLCLLQDSAYINARQYTSIAADCNELISMLVATVKTSKLH